MNNLNPKKLLNSKWTATPAINKEKHFIIVEVEYDEEGNVIELNALPSRYFLKISTQYAGEI
jgi:tryptophan-rich hypothetical protein